MPGPIHLPPRTPDDCRQAIAHNDEGTVRSLLRQVDGLSQLLRETQARAERAEDEAASLRRAGGRGRVRPGLRAIQRKMLSALRGQRRPMQAAALARAVHLAESTVLKEMPELVRKKLAEHARGEDGGYTITPKGCAALAACKPLDR